MKQNLIYVSIFFAVFLGLFLGLGSLATPVAFADAQVVVKVSGSGDQSLAGRVVLKAQNGDVSYSCRTNAEGVCTILRVPEGSYVATFHPRDGEPSRPRRVMVGSGDVELRLRAPG